MGPPTFLEVDHGSAYLSKETSWIIEVASVTFEEAPVKKPSSTGIFVQYYAPLRKENLEISSTRSKEDAPGAEWLRISLYAVNYTISSDVFSRCPLVSEPNPTQRETQHHQHI